MAEHINSQAVAEQLRHFINQTKEQSLKTLENIDIDMYKDAVELILDAEANNNRVHITGIGKPAHIGGYIASLMSSTGTAAYELHGTEAVHGSCGQVRPGDVVIAISNSGNTAELMATVDALKANGAKVIGVSGNENSLLAQASDVLLRASVANEGGPLNRAPRNSILAEIMVLQGLTVALQSIKNITPQQYVTWHPNGALGQLRSGEI